MSQLTTDQIVQAAREAVDDPNYRQSLWAPPETDCKTACCVLGRARLIAGLPQIDKGPQSGELPGGKTSELARLLKCSSPGVARALSQACINASGDLDLIQASLSGADLSGADLSGANLTGADLTEADLSGANLNGADLTGADLSDVAIDRADLADAIQ